MRLFLVTTVELKSVFNLLRMSERAAKVWFCGAFALKVNDDDLN